jgi:hypothetical protein
VTLMWAKLKVEEALGLLRGIYNELVLARQHREKTPTGGSDG